MDQLWYALYVKSRLEKAVLTQLERKGYETFLPTYSAGPNSTVSLPLFPNYVFCRFDVCARLPILVTPGVHFVVGAGRVPTAVDEAEIQALRRLRHEETAVQPWPYVAAGETVTVVAGPLTGLTGIVLRTKRSNRLIISISLLMRSVAVEIDCRQVQPSPLRTLRAVF